MDWVNTTARRETFKFVDLVRLMVDVWRLFEGIYMLKLRENFAINKNVFWMGSPGIISTINSDSHACPYPGFA